MPYKLEKDPEGKGWFVVSSDTGKKHSDKPIPRKNAVAQMRALYMNVPEARKEIGNITVFKDSSGAWRWVAYSSNSFRDLDKEIVSQKALEEDVDRADQDLDFGPLRWWHLKGVDIGECDFNMMEGKVLIESGTFKSDSIAMRVKEQAPNLQVSIGFRHPLIEPDSEGVYHTIRRFERSILPAGKAANPLTRFFVKGVDMASKEEKEKAFAELLKDPEAAQAILTRAAEIQKEATAGGTAFKEADTQTDKAKKKVPPEDPADVEGSPKEEAGETASQEAAEKPVNGKPKKGVNPFVKKELEPEAETEKHGDESEGAFAIGDVPIEEFYDTLAEVLGNILTPISKELTAIKEAQATKTKEASDAQNSQETRIKALEALVAKATKELKELQAETPAVVRGYSATEDPNTVVSDETAKEKIPPQGTGGNDVMDFINSFALGGLAVTPGQ